MCFFFAQINIYTVEKAKNNHDPHTLAKQANESHAQDSQR
jgi:hypothetical protein